LFALVGQIKDLKDLNYLPNDNFYDVASFLVISGVPRGVGGPPPPEIPKAFQNRAQLNPIVKTVKIC